MSGNLVRAPPQIMRCAGGLYLIEHVAVDDAGWFMNMRLHRAVASWGRPVVSHGP